MFGRVLDDCEDWVAGGSLSEEELIKLDSSCGKIYCCARGAGFGFRLSELSGEDLLVETVFSGELARDICLLRVLGRSMEMSVSQISFDVRADLRA